MRTCAFRGCLAAVVGSVRVTKDPARREPYTIDVCHAHRVAVLAAEGNPLPQPAPDAPIPEDEPMPSPRLPRPPKPPPHLLVRKANPHIGFCVIEGCDATVGSRGICSNHQKSLPKEHYERLANPARQGGRPPKPDAVKVSPLLVTSRNPGLPQSKATDADAANKKPVDLGDVPGWPPTTIVQHYADFKAKLSADLTAGWPLAWAPQRDTTDGQHDWICPVEASPLESGDGWVHSPVADLAVRWVDGARYPWMLFVLDSEGDELFEVEANTPAHLRTMYAAWQVFPVQQDGFSLQRQFSTALERAWDREWILEADNNQPLRWISRNLLNGQTSLIVWWDDAWHWHAVDGDRLLALGAGEDTIAIYDQYQAWNKGTVVVDNDWDGAIEKGGGDSDSLRVEAPATVPAAVAATMAEAQLAEAGRLAVQVEGLQADLDTAKTEINHLEKDLKRAQDGWDKSDAAREEMETQLETARARIAELEGARDALRKLRDQMLIKVATITVCHDHHLRELRTAAHMLKALGIEADSVVVGIQKLAQLPGNVLARRWAAWSHAQDLMGQAEMELRVARGEVDDA